jgi:chemotaxis protein CheD
VKITVEIADFKVTKDSDSVITTLNLGSCVGIALYDPNRKIAGLAHIMLPDSTNALDNSNPAKFADSALALMLQEMTKLGANKAALQAKIAGGAQMFFSPAGPASRIGQRNADTTSRLLRLYGIPILGQDVGLNYARTVELYSKDGSVVIKTAGRADKAI